MIAAKHEAVFRAQVARHKARRRAERVALLRTMGGAPQPFCVPCAGGFALAVHRDTYEATAGQWRVTRFDGVEPAGHEVFSTWADAIGYCQTWRAILCLARNLRVV